MWYVITMIPIFIVVAFIKHIPLSLSILFIGIAGLLYHSYKHQYPQLLWVDLIAILLGFSAYTYYSKMDDSVKNYLLILEGLITVSFFVSALVGIMPVYKRLAAIVGCVWVPVLFFSMKYFSNFTVFFTSIVLLMYFYSECMCNTHKYTYLVWPVFHVSLFYLLYLCFSDMDMVTNVW